MPHYRHNGTEYREVVAAARRNGSAYQNILGKWRWVSGAWVKYFGAGGGGGPLTALIHPAEIMEHSGASNGTIASSAIASVSGGTPPYSYEWAMSGSAISIDGPDSIATVHLTSTVSGQEDGTATFRFGTLTLNVTDSAAGTASDSASVTHQHGGAIV